jgi:hypothetical protein
VFRSGRDFAAWLGLTPRQNSSGGKQTLGGITKKGTVGLQADWTCLEKVEGFPWMKGELDDEAEGIYARV